MVSVTSSSSLKTKFEWLTCYDLIFLLIMKPHLGFGELVDMRINMKGTIDVILISLTFIGM